MMSTAFPMASLEQKAILNLLDQVVQYLGAIHEQLRRMGNPACIPSCPVTPKPRPEAAKGTPKPSSPVLTPFPSGFLPIPTGGLPGVPCTPEQAQEGQCNLTLEKR